MHQVAGGVEFREVSFVAGGRTLLDRVNLTVEADATTAILGRSGSGKTTLLRTVNRMLEPSGGDVWVNGRSTRAEDVIPLRRGMGYVIQETGLFPHFNVLRNAGVVLEIEGRPKAETGVRAREMLSLVGMDAERFGTRYPHQLSGGQRQRVGLARALAADPPILLMDEPFGALDPLTRAEMQDMLRDLLQRLHKTVLLVTHDLDEALYLASRIVLLADGRVVADLAADEFLGSRLPEVTGYVAAFHRGAKEAGGPESSREQAG